MIAHKLERYARYQSGEFDVKILKGRYGDLKRLRIGNYRIIFEDAGEEMLVYEIRHRQEAYND
jgi:mRNA-degrading endonuclease RelE of RelBE toxin-antitoxin system